MAIYGMPDTQIAPSEDEAFLRESLGKIEDTPVSKLAKYVESIWKQNKADNKQTRLNMVKLLRRSRGEYEASKLAAIRAFKGSEVFIRSGESKCRAAESWLKDIYRGDKDLPWLLEPTALPDLPQETVATITEQIRNQGMQLQEQLIASGQIVDPQEIANLMNDWQDKATKDAKNELSRSAKEKCEQAAKLIRDQNQEGGWATAFKDFLWYLLVLMLVSLKDQYSPRNQSRCGNLPPREASQL
jgi:hypothetical protein